MSEYVTTAAQRPRPDACEFDGYRAVGDLGDERYWHCEREPLMIVWTATGALWACGYHAEDAGYEPHECQACGTRDLVDRETRWAIGPRDHPDYEPDQCPRCGAPLCDGCALAPGIHTCEDDPRRTLPGHPVAAGSAGHDCCCGGCLSLPERKREQDELERRVRTGPHGDDPRLIN